MEAFAEARRRSLAATCVSLVLEEWNLQRIKGLAAAFAVGTPLAVFLWFWLHATIEVAVLLAGIVGTAIYLVVSTRSDAHDDAADLAWREISPDLAPASERSDLIRAQEAMAGPDRKAKPTPKPRRASSQGQKPASQGEPK
jgi:hypothetical protein